MTAPELALAPALARLYAVRPMWTDVRSAAEAVGLAPMTLLHAGPPFADPCQPSAPVLSSAVLCCLYEGWARSESEAQGLIASGQVRLRPAQDLRVVTPLAAVISPATTLVEVRDGVGARSWSLLGSGSGPQIRFGTRNPAVLDRLRWRDGRLAAVLHQRLQAAPVALLPLAVAGLEGGDDLHSCTTAATTALQHSLGLDDLDVTAMLDSTPLFFLTLWMAACHLMLDATCDPARPTRLVLALAGNGVDVGVRLADQPQRWLTAPAHVPDGPRIKPGATLASPMLGDSGVIDAAGFGAQAWHHSIDVARSMNPWRSPGEYRRPGWLRGEHPLFAGFHLGSAIDASRVTFDQPAPWVAIAMLDGAGEQGLLGRGLCRIDPALFGAPAQAGPHINQPHTLAALTEQFAHYEQALISNDIAVLDALFWNSPHTLRYGPREHLYGYAAIQAFRQGRPATGLDRAIEQRSLTTFGSEFAVTHIVFSRFGQPRLGRQTQSWVCFAGEWRIVAAHVSWMDL
ncbi:oxalurate catabolism protein HpxZ [Pseudomonas sp. dw_358]|uniref:oxalurate catabolism protein HpxZ n=1 Tax=Pseudomonas sp. dw_358 TaxID=2720083 RepID=UPI001BD62BEB|nr:oxalurate catabolism protein HpxZ [Pseudomonas sp. dw_358]